MQNYPWPASAITEADMALLFQAREHSPSHVPINALIAEAVRKTFGPTSTRDDPQSQTETPEAPKT